MSELEDVTVSLLVALGQSTEVQSVLLSRTRFKTVQDARKWIKDHGFSSHKVDTTENFYRFRQKDPSAFKKGSLRTIKLVKDGSIKAIVGRPK